MELEIALVQSGVISAEDYVAAVARQQEERPPLGQIAIEEGVLSVRRVLELLQAQNESPDLRFGEIALELGYLRPEQLGELLRAQEVRERPLLDHLVDLGLLTPEEAGEAVRLFREGHRMEKLLGLKRERVAEERIELEPQLA